MLGMKIVFISRVVIEVYHQLDHKTQKCPIPFKNIHLGSKLIIKDQELKLKNHQIMTRIKKVGKETYSILLQMPHKLKLNFRIKE